MKKRGIIKKLTFLLFVLTLLISYLYIYIFPSVKKISRLKRGIRGHSLMINDLKMEKIVFFGSDEKEMSVFREVEKEFRKRLSVTTDQDSLNLAVKETRDHLKNMAADIRISDLRMTLSDAGTQGFRAVNSTISFFSGLSTGSRFTGMIPGSGQYILVKKLKAEKREGSYLFNIQIEILFRDEELDSRSVNKTSGGTGLIDKDSPLLKRPVYLSPIKLVGKGAGQDLKGEDD